MKIIKIAILICASLVVGNAQGLTLRQRQVVGQIMPNGAIITKGLHDEFWADAPKGERESTKRIISNYIDYMVGDEMDFAMEGWVSAKISYELRVPVLTIRLLELKDKVRKNAEEKSGLSKGTQGYTDFMAGFNQNFERAYSTTLNMIRCSAEHRPMMHDIKGEVNLTPELFDFILSGYKGTKEKLRKLLDRDWVE